MRSVNKELLGNCLYNNKISLKEKAIYANMLIEENKIYTEYDFITPLDKMHSVKAGFDVLIKHGYIEKVKDGFVGYKIKGAKIKEINATFPGYVYILHDTLGHYKIGYAKNVGNRLVCHRTSMPYTPVVIKILTCNDMRKGEKFLHDKFKNKNISKEWFKLDEEDLKYIESLTGEYYQ